MFSSPRFRSFTYFIPLGVVWLCINFLRLNFPMLRLDCKYNALYPSLYRHRRGLQKQISCLSVFCDFFMIIDFG